MKKCITLTLVWVIWLLSVAAVPVAASDVAVTAAVDFNSAYVWRAMTFNDGLVAQPSIDVAKGGFGINIWGNLDIDDYDDALEGGEFSEIDLTVSYGCDIGAVNVAVGFIEYLFPTTDAGGAEGTREVYISVGGGIPAGLDLTLDVYYDIDEVDDYYAELGLSYGLDVNDKTSFGAGLSVAYAGEEYAADGDAGLYSYTISLSIGYAINDNWGVSAGVNFVDALDDDKLADVDDGGPLDVNAYGGVSISYTF